MVRCGTLGILFSLVLCFTSSMGWAEDMQARLGRAVEAKEIVGLHSAVVVLDGERIAEAYFPGEDERWGMPIGSVDHGPDTLHDLRSITKSVVGLLYGIALSEGVVPAVDARLLDQFPDYADLHDGSARERITVADALTMRMGTAWDENLPYTDPRNSEIAMERAEDRYRFALSRPMVAEPGTTWTYNGGAVALIAKLIADGTGQDIIEFARTRLFDPLGIKRFEWVGGKDGVASAASGLRLTARDLAKIGVMVAQGGTYEGREVVPASWLEASFQRATSILPGFDYGYLWYLAKGPGGDQILIAQGNGGQRLTVQPRVGFVVSTFAGNYNDPAAWQTAVRVLVEFAVPEVGRHRQK